MSEKALNAKVLWSAIKDHSGIEKKPNVFQRRFREISEVFQSAEEYKRSLKYNRDAYKYVKQDAEPEKVSDIAIQTVRASKKDFEMEAKDESKISMRYDGEDVESERRKREQEAHQRRGMGYLGKRGIMKIVSFGTSMTIGQNKSLYGQIPR